MNCTHSSTGVAQGGDHSFSCAVHNIGTRAGDEVIMVFQRPMANVRAKADHALPLKRLIDFDRMGPIAPGASATVGFTVSPTTDLQFATAAGGMTLYGGTHELVFWRGSGAEVAFPIEVAAPL